MSKQVCIANLSAGDSFDLKEHRPIFDLALDEFALSRLVTPFTWGYVHATQPLKSRCEIIAEMEKKLDDCPDNNSDDVRNWHVFSLQLTLCYETWKNGDYAKSVEKLEKCERILESVLENEKDFLCIHRDAIEHILVSSRYCLSQGQAERDELIATLQPEEAWSDRKMAGVCGMRAAVSMEYGYRGTTEAVRHIRKAIELDPDSAEWHFAYGKCLGRQRHVERSFEVLSFNVAELKALETAVELSSNPYYMVFLAQAYREAATCLAQERDNVVEAHRRKMNDRAAQLYMLVLKMRPDCPFINVRCAQGFMRFDPSHRDMEIAHACGLKAVQLEPDNVMINHVWGQINTRLGNVRVAVQALTRAQNAYGANIDLVKLKTRNCQPYDPLPDLARMLTKFLEPPYQAATLAQEASYRYFVRNEAARAVQLIMRIVRMDPLSERLKDHQPDVFRTRNRQSKLNLYLVLLKELPHAMDDEGRADYAEVLAICDEHYPKLLEDGALAALAEVRVLHPPTNGRRVERPGPRMERPACRSDSDRNWRRGDQMAPLCPVREAPTSWRSKRIEAVQPPRAASWRDKRLAGEGPLMPFAREGGGDGPSR